MEHCENLTWFKKQLQNTELVEQLKKTKLVITDIDGCLTNSNIYPNGSDETKGFSVQDGFATAKAIKAGLNIALLTGKKGPILEQRAATLGIPPERRFFGYCSDKIKAVKKIQQDGNFSKEETLFFGDDFLDVEVRSAVKMFVCPNNAIFYIKPQADLVLPRPGGKGAFRLLLDLVMYVQQIHFAQTLIENALR